jgi:hypothetical protein
VFDLMISVKDMPPGWHMLGNPGKSIDTNRPALSSEADFRTENHPNSEGATLSIYQYRTAIIAHRDYEDILKEYVNSGQVDIQNWKFKSKYADEYAKSCLAYKNIDYPVCTYVARYKEYVFIFFSWLEPGRMTIEQMETVVEKN